jgi:hypothetical protein
MVQVASSIGSPSRVQQAGDDSVGVFGRPLLFAIGRALGLIIKSSRAAFYGLWSKARWLRRTTAGALAGRDF